jgi:hypothetical protein
VRANLAVFIESGRGTGPRTPRQPLAEEKVPMPDR